MLLNRLTRFSVFVTLSLRTLLLLHHVLTSQIDNGPQLTPHDKRLNNFGVPMEMPYDTSFWPSRGRRGFFPMLKAPRQPFTGICSLKDTDLDAYRDLEDHLLADDGCGRMGKELWQAAAEASRMRQRKKVAEVWDVRGLVGGRGLEEVGKKKQRNVGFPGGGLLVYGSGVYWEPENPYGEKKKKEDVFWVARGKKDVYSGK